MRATERGIQNVEFVVADMERLPFEDETFDAVISNGAFCLAPNKEKAFAEIFRVLKPGGRMSICTSTTKVNQLDEGVNWPLCMRMFIAKDIIQSLCTKLGFTDVYIDESDSSMTLEIPDEILGDDTPVRNKVHVGSDEFKHLKHYDMDKICARVCVVGKKHVKTQSS
jgi:SAM-dependent methyltransferase